MWEGTGNDPGGGNRGPHNQLAMESEGKVTSREKSDFKSADKTGGMTSAYSGGVVTDWSGLAAAFSFYGFLFAFTVLL